MTKIRINQLFFSLFAILLIWSVSINLRYPYIGIYVTETSDGQFVIERIDKDGLAGNLKLRAGDKVLSINGGPPEAFMPVLKWRSIERADSMIILNDDQTVEYHFDLKNNIPTISNVSQMLCGALCLSVAALLYRKIKRSSSARMLAYVFMAGGMLYISVNTAMKGDMLGKLIELNCMMVLPVLFYHFLVIFFREKGNIQIPAKILKYLYAFVFAGMVVKLVYFVPDLAFVIARFRGKIEVLFFVLGFILNFIVLGILFFRHRTKKSPVSSIIKIVWISLCASFAPLVLLSFIPFVVIGDQFIRAQFTSIFALLFPLTFAYLIASDQIYDIALVLRRFIFAFLFSIVPCGALTGLYALVFPIETDVKHLLFLFSASVIISSFVMYATEYFSTRVERFIFPRKYMMQSALKKIAKQLGAISNIRELRESVLIDIVKTLEVDGGAIIFKFADHIEMIHEGQMDEEEVGLFMNASQQDEHPLFISFVIHHHESYTSYLVLTRTKSNSLLGKEDIQWLQLIISYLAVNMENIHLIRKLTMKLQEFAAQMPEDEHAQDFQWFRKLMFELQEEERVRIATELHDTTMQDLFFLKRKLVSLVGKLVINPEDKEQLDSLVAFVELINTNLRQNCFELNPYLIKEVGLIKTLRKMLDSEAILAPFEIEFHTEQDVMIENNDLVTKKHIFRIIQELLNNAKKHSEASKLFIHISVKDSFLYLIYSDDGVGFEVITDQTKTSSKSSGIGIEYLKGRVHHLNGELNLESTIGFGVHCMITIPM